MYESVVIKQDSYYIFIVFKKIIKMVRCKIKYLKEKYKKDKYKVIVMIETK